MKKVFLSLLAAALTLGAMSITVESPKTGDVLRVGDTVFIKYSCDDEYLAASNGVLICVSPVHYFWSDMHPLNIPDISINTVYKNNPAWGNVPVVIADSATGKMVFPGPIKDSIIYNKRVSMVSDSVRFKIKDYFNVASATSGYCAIRTPVPAVRPPAQFPKTFPTPDPDAAASLFTPGGRRIASAPYRELKQVSARLRPGVYLVEYVSGKQKNAELRRAPLLIAR